MSGGCPTVAPTGRWMSTSRGFAGNWGRLRSIFLVVATSSLVLVSFLLPLAIVLRTQAADRAISAATIQAQGMTPLVATLRPRSLRLAVDQMNAENGTTPITVFLPGGRELGVTASRSAPVRLAAKGRSFTTAMPAGVEIGRASCRERV